MAATPDLPSRPWRVIAEELKIERDGNRVLELTDELNSAIDEQQKPPSTA